MYIRDYNKLTLKDYGIDEEDTRFHLDDVSSLYLPYELEMFRETEAWDFLEDIEI